MPGRLLPLNQKEIQEVHNFIQEHLKRGTIRESWSPYAANFFFIKKKDGKLRPVQDYRPINKWTRRNQNVSPLIPQVINRLRGCTLFTKVDVRWGYNNIRIKEGDKWKAAFLTPEGLFEPTVMFFGLTNSPATFQMMMNTIFCTEVAQGWLFIYMDDIAIHTKHEKDETEQQHLERHQLYTHHMLHKLEQNNLYLKPKKCDFEKKEIDYLGVIVGNGWIQMDPKKLKGVTDWPVPRRLACPPQPNRNPKIPWIYRLLPILRPRILENSTPITRPHEKGRRMALGRIATQSIRRTQNSHVLPPRPHATRLQ